MVILLEAKDRNKTVCHFCGAHPVKYSIQDAPQITSCNNPRCFGNLKEHDSLLTQNATLKSQINKFKLEESFRLNPDPPY